MSSGQSSGFSPGEQEEFDFYDHNEDFVPTGEPLSSGSHDDGGPSAEDTQRGRSPRCGAVPLHRTGVIYLVDLSRILKDLPLRNLTALAAFGGRLSRLFSDGFPEAAARIYFLNTPWPFRTLYRATARFCLDAETQEKVVILGGDWEEALRAAGVV